MPVEATPSKNKPSSKSAKGAKPVVVPREKPSGYNLSACNNFLFIAHPTCYDVFPTAQGPEILPILKKLEYQPGINGVMPVRGSATGDGDPTFAIASKQQQGWLVVPPDMPVVAFGENEDGYVHFVMNNRGHEVHLSVWERPYMLGDSTYFDNDQDGYHAFLRKVRDEVMPEIDPNVYKVLQARLKDMASKAKASKSSLSADIADEIDKRMTVFAKAAKK